MKNIFIIYVLSQLSILTINAQKALPNSLHPYSVNWHASIVEGLQLMGYSVPTKGDQHADQTGSISTHSGNLRLDSTITFYGYIAADSTPLFCTRFAYPNASRKFEKSAHFDNDNWLDTNRSTIDTDPSGRIVVVETEVFNPETKSYQFDSRLSAYPNGNSFTEVDSLFAWQWDMDKGNWKLLISIRNEFNEKGQLMNTNSFLDLFGQPTKFRDNYTYNNAGNITLIQSYLLVGDLELLTGFRELSYANNLPTKVVTYKMDEQFQPLPQNRIEYIYNNFGKEDTVKSYEWDFCTQNWVKEQEEFFLYDAQKRNIFKERRTFQDGEEEREQVVYKYLEGDLSALEEFYIWDSGGFYFLWERKYYYYSGGTTAVSIRPKNSSLIVLPNPSDDFLRLGLENEALWHIFDMRGAHLSREFAYQDNAIYISELPSGTNFITAKTTNGFLTGKIVKE